MKTFWRLLGFLRPYKRGVIFSFVLAIAAIGVSLLIPYLVGVTVDEIRNHNPDLLPLALAVAGAGVLRLAFSVARRLVAAGMPVAALSPLALARWVGDRLRGEAR